MKKNYYYVWDVTSQYLVSNPKSEDCKQLRRRVIVEQLDENLNLTGNKFICILTDHSALADIRSGDYIEADLTFDVSEDCDQLVFAKIKSTRDNLW